MEDHQTYLIVGLLFLILRNTEEPSFLQKLFTVVAGMYFIMSAIYLVMNIVK